METELNRLIDGLEQRTTAELAVVTVPNTQGYASPKAFTTQLFNHWGIGKAEQNNGILFLISVGDRRVEIETGNGLGSQLPDTRVAQIINTQITPRFREGDFEGGTLAGVRQLIAELERGVASGISRSRVGSAGPTVTATEGSLATIDTSLLEGILLLLGIGGLGLGWQSTRRPLYLRSGSSGQRARELKQLDQRNGGVRLFLYGGSLLLGVFGVIVSQHLLVFLLPLMAIFATDGTLRFRRGIPFHSVECERCRQPMQRIKPTELHSYLSEPEFVAHSRGRAYYYGWLCPTCRGVSTLVAEKPFFRRYQCPRCQAPTMDLRTEILSEATYSHPGYKLETFTCPCCQYRSEKEIEIPRLTYTESSSFSDSGGSSSSSGSDFGGGSSSGGGAGGSW